MPTNNHDRRTQDSPVRAIVPRTVTERLSRIENLLLEMRHEQDVLLKRLTRTQAQLDGLIGKSPASAARRITSAMARADGTESAHDTTQ